MQSRCLLMCSWDTLLLVLKCTVRPIDATPPTDGQKKPGSKRDAPLGQLQVQAANSKKTVKQTNKKKSVLQNQQLQITRIILPLPPRELCESSGTASFAGFVHTAFGSKSRQKLENRSHAQVFREITETLSNSASPTKSETEWLSSRP